LTQSAKDFKSLDLDPKGAYVSQPETATRTELFLKRGKCDRKQIAETTAKGIATSLEARRLQDLEDRQREPEEMSTVGLEVDLTVKAKT
jgi:hypothetical protein